MNQRFVFLLLLSLAVAACSSGPSASPLQSSRATAAAAFAPAPQDRPGFGTKWGETRPSAASVTTFVRATPNEPIAAAEIFYNDREGIEAMAAASEFRRVWPILRGPAASLLLVGLKDQSGRFLPGLSVGDRWFVIGEEGRRYLIVLQNRSEVRLEAVVSVDGLDVIDGRPASVRKGGYVINPHRKISVEGFRQSSDAVAAFRFSPVRESYAQEKYRNSRNIGVIGVALFHERGTFPLDRSRSAEAPAGEPVSESLCYPA